jgi:hypothetical protein
MGEPRGVQFVNRMLASPALVVYLRAPRPRLARHSFSRPSALNP